MAPNQPYQRYSRDGFQPLTAGSHDVTVDIPMEHIDHLHNGNGDGVSEATAAYNQEKAVVSSYKGAGYRRSMRLGGHSSDHHRGYDGERDVITKMGMFYNKVLGFSTVTRYLVYVLPLGVVFVIPIAIGATVAKNANIGGVSILWFFVWIECSWVGLWVSKLLAHYLPYIFQFLCGFVSSGVRKYSLVIKALEIPLSLVGWAVVSLATFMPIMQRNPATLAAKADGQVTNTPHWETVVQRILAAALISSLIYLAEKLLIHLISIDYHRKQFALRIKESKRNIHRLSLLYDASRMMFPAFCNEFAEEDAIISDLINFPIYNRRKKHGHSRSGSSTPMRLVRDVGRFGDRLTSAFGNVAQEITGKQVFNPDGAYSVVVEALEKNRSAEALARRLWLSFVIEGREALYQEDIVEVLGEQRQTEAEESFASLDQDRNGDVSLDEMIMTVTEWGRERRAIASSMHDLDQAIKVLDRLLAAIVGLATVFTFIAFLNTSFVTTLATAGTTLLSLSFVFSVTAQEVLGSCIFLFVKHPYDIGDRVDISSTQLVVEHISLLFTVFKRVDTHRMVQYPNNVLNSLAVENVSRSGAMREQLSIFVDFKTTFEDIQLLRNEMSKFVADGENSRDFQPDVDVEVLGIGSMDKMELRIEIRHKSNWSNETIRAARRSKFMCALVLALRKVPVNAPGGGGPALGDPKNPSYNVAFSDKDAIRARELDAEAKNAARMVPVVPAIEESTPELTELTKKDTLATPSEKRATDSLNARHPAHDGARDPGADREVASTALDRTGSEGAALEEVRNVLRRQTTKGRRKFTRRKNAPLDTSVPSIGLTQPTPLEEEDYERRGWSLDGYDGPREGEPTMPRIPAPKTAYMTPPRHA